MSGKLPLNNIDVITVRNAIGYGGTDVAGAVLHTGVNRWGIFTPDLPEWTKFFGVQPTSPYPLGVFRGYEHDWRCYALSKIIDKTKPLIENHIMITVDYRYFPNYSIEHGIQQNWSVFFSRSNNFHQGGGVAVSGFTNVNFGTSFEITISKSNPPDGGPALSDGQTIFVKIQRNGNPITNNWDNRQSEDIAYTATSSEVYWIKSITIPNNPFQMTMGFDLATNFYAWNAGIQGRGVGAEIFVVNNSPYQKTATIEVKWELSSTTLNTLTLDITVPAAVLNENNTITPSVASNYVEGVVSGAMAVGATVTPYARFSSVPSGITAPTSFVKFTDITVGNTLPVNI